MIPTTLRANPPDPILRVELDQGAFNHGYRKPNGEADGWLFYYSDEGVPGEIALGSCKLGEQGPWFLAVEHAGVGSAMTAEFAGNLAGPIPNGFKAAFGFGDKAEMRSAVSRAFHLARSLPSFPLAQFEADVKGLGDTEIERIVRQRIGQEHFRQALIDYWGKCPITGIAEPALLRASHIKAWAECDSDAERLDVFNGLLLAVHWDAAFDKGLVSFDDEGCVLVKPGLDPAVLTLLAPDTVKPLALADAHRTQLVWHREHFEFAG